MANLIYESVLKNSGFSYSMKFETATDETKIFLKLVRKHFPRFHKFNKIFNLNTVKISDSSISNVNKFNQIA